MKINQFKKIFKSKKIDFALFYNIDFDKIEENMLYFSQYSGSGLLIIPSTKSPFMIAPKMEVTRAKKGLIKKVHTWNKEKKLFENTKHLLKKEGIKPKRIGIDENNFSINAFKELKKNFKGSKFIDISKDCLKLRETKTKEEIKIIRKAYQISNNILNSCLKNFKSFKTESDVKAFLEYEAKKQGCELAFPTIVASGKNAVKPHHDTEKSKLKKGFCVIDFGIRFKNYCTDITRTVYLGKPTEKEKEIYNFLLNVQKEAIKSIKISKNCSDLYKETKKRLEGYQKYFTHGLGHGVGIKIHELPNLTEKSKDKVQNNTLFTIEPGIYLKTMGIRIEDSILIYRNKPHIMTNIKKDFKNILN